MHLLWRRYSRSGYAPSWFYAVLGSGFVALACWALFEGDWIVGAIALAMVAVTVGGSRVMRRLPDVNGAPVDPNAPKEDADER